MTAGGLTQPGTLELLPGDSGPSPYSMSSHLRLLWSSNPPPGVGEGHLTGRLRENSLPNVCKRALKMKSANTQYP